jgi:hypothetical protein
VRPPTTEKNVYIKLAEAVSMRCEEKLPLQLAVVHCGGATIPERHFKLISAIHTGKASSEGLWCAPPADIAA